MATRRKTILITGASTGIGSAAARYFQQRDWNVAATMRKPEAGAELAKLDRVLVTNLDVTDESSIGAAIERVAAQFGDIDVLVTTPGMASMGSWRQRLRRTCENSSRPMSSVC